MDMGPICHVIHETYKKKLEKIFVFSFQILWLIGGIKVMGKYKMSAQYL